MIIMGPTEALSALLYMTCDKSADVTAVESDVWNPVCGCLDDLKLCDRVSNWRVELVAPAFGGNLEASLVGDIGRLGFVCSCS